MDASALYKTMTNNLPFSMREYITPRCSVDPKQMILERNNLDYKKKQKQGKFKIVTKPKVCYFDEIIIPIKNYPDPSKYKTEGNLIKKSKSSPELNKVNLKAKKGSYIDNIEEFEKKFKPPGIGKFDLTKYSDIGTKKFSSIKPNKDRIKHNNFDDAIKLAAQLPGPGQFNPHESIEKLKVNRNDMKFWKEKHNAEEKKFSKSLSTKMGPTTYKPIKADTFQSIAASKVRPVSRWSHGQIDIRKGIRSQMKQPGPSMYNTVHQWGKLGFKEKEIGNFNVLNRICSARSVGVYH